ncbi:MAG: GNAT family N-acetyltransferase [Xanthomonadales bacterium]|nr:GNAT family N-acetyltransferase [Xanthomonadales bacterium]MCE7932759.1 GNAT family N-acetyltransferase [Xanthomonadales bacterium PRO6]
MPGWCIESLARHPQFVDTLATWHHAEWQSLVSPWTLDEARAELAGHVASEPYPITWVGLDENHALAGSISLIETDVPEFAHYTPWLASLYVRPECRARGLGETLVRTLLAHATGLGFECVYLFTPGTTAMYQRCGFVATATLPLGGRAVTLMECALP